MDGGKRTGFRIRGFFFRIEPGSIQIKKGLYQSKAKSSRRGTPHLLLGPTMIIKASLKHRLLPLLILQNLYRFTESQAVYDFTLTQELQTILNVHVIGHID